MKTFLYKADEYAKIVACFETDGDACKFEIKLDNHYAYYNFIKRKIQKFENEKFYDIITPFDYGGIYYSSIDILPLFFEKFSLWCKENYIVSEFLRFDPCATFDFNIFSYYIDVKKINDLIYVDLSIEFWNFYSKGRKSDIAKTKKLSYKVFESSIDFFYDIYIETMERNGSHDYFYFNKQALSLLVKNDFARVFSISIDNQVLSSIMILDDECHSYYFLGSSKSDTISLDANALLIHEVALVLKNENRKMFFLGGGRDGVYNFKQRFSKKTLPYYIGKKIHNQSVYDDLVKLANKSENNFFPQYREKII
jgi:hypothetical protein